MTDMSKADSADAIARCNRLNVWPTAHDDALHMFMVAADEQYDGDAFETWLHDQVESKSYLFIPTGDADTENASFGENKNITIRAKYRAEIGEAAFAERARAWGLGSADDYKTVGKRPGDAAVNETKNKGKPDPSNPFSAAGWNITKQGAVVKRDRALAERLAASCGVVIGQTRPNL